MNREEVRMLLLGLAWEEIVRQALADRRVVRSLLGLLYDGDDYVHWLAIEAIGRVGGALADVDPEKTRELVRRLLWNLNDESGSTPWGAAGAIGAITASRPDLFGGYMSILFPFHEDASICPELFWAASTVGAARPELVREYIPILLVSLEHAQAQIRGYAAKALGMLGVKEAEQALSRLSGDKAPVAVYCGGGGYLRTCVAVLAADSVARLHALRRG